jgi:hypothetical protein
MAQAGHGVIVDFRCYRVPVVKSSWVQPVQGPILWYMMILTSVHYLISLCTQCTSHRSLQLMMQQIKRAWHRHNNGIAADKI